VREEKRLIEACI